MKLKEIICHGGGRYGWEHWCPGCNDRHSIPTSGHKAWEFNGDTALPTFSPSVLNTWKNADDGIELRCHYYIVDGTIQYCGDCTHALAGQTVPLPELPP